MCSLRYGTTWLEVVLRSRDCATTIDSAGSVAWLGGKYSTVSAARMRVEVDAGIEIDASKDETRQDETSACTHWNQVRGKGPEVLVSRIVELSRRL